jgi:hypothetical protein
VSDTKQEPYRLDDAELDRLAEKPVLGAELAADRLRWTEAEIIRLRAEVAALKAERDEARQRCCIALVGTGVWRQPRMNLPGGSWTPQLIAKEHGWDCFEKEVQK